MEWSIPEQFVASKPEPVKSLAEAFDLFRFLANRCELVQVCLRAPEEKLALPRAEQFNQLANQLLYTFTVACDILKSGNLHSPLAARYTSPLRFRNISSTSYASLTKDVALAHVKVVEDYWREIHGGKIVHVTLNPQYAFETEQVAEIRKRFEFLKTFTFPGTANEQLEAIRASFGELIVGLRQEQAWATAGRITLASNAKSGGAEAESLHRLQQAAAGTGEPATPAQFDTRKNDGVEADHLETISKGYFLPIIIRRTTNSTQGATDGQAKETS